MSVSALVTVAVPSYNQGRYLEDALHSIFRQRVPLEVFVADGGSSDGSVDVIRKWEKKLTGWRSHADEGQSAAINECLSRGHAPYVCWLNSDDYWLPNALASLVKVLEENPESPAAYARAWNYIEETGAKRPVWVEKFQEHRLALRCIISQPACLIRREAWEAAGGLDETLHMAMDYDLWWRLYKWGGSFAFLDEYVAVNRIHHETKTKTYRRRHYTEAMNVVRRHYGRVPLKWWIVQPYAVWLKAIIR